jgi:hypothetical protein
MIAPAPSPFERWAVDRQYDIAPAVLPTPHRVYADRQTQAAYEAWTAGAASVARMFTDSTLETEALRERIRRLGGRA